MYSEFPGKSVGKKNQKTVLALAGVIMVDLIC